MTVKEVKRLDDENERAAVTVKAKSGDDHAAALLFFWAQWQRIKREKGLRPKEKVYLLAELMSVTRLTFTYG